MLVVLVVVIVRTILTRPPSCSLFNSGRVHQEGVDPKEEDEVAPGQILQALEQQELHLSGRLLRKFKLPPTYFELVEKEGIDSVDDVEKEISSKACQHQRLSGESEKSWLKKI